MAIDDTATNGVANGTNGSTAPSFTVKAGLAQMLKGGVIMDVINAEQVCLRDGLEPLCQVAKLPAGAHCRRSRRCCSHGLGTSACRYSSTGWSSANVRSRPHQRDPGCRDHTRHGQGSHRSYCRMPGKESLLLHPANTKESRY